MSETLSLELSKRLDELSVKVESADHFYETDIHPRLASPTFLELWKILPISIFKEEDTWDLCMAKDGDQTMVGYFCPVPDVKDNRIVFRHESPTEAAGLLVIWLAEKGHLKGDGYESD